MTTHENRIGAGRRRARTIFSAGVCDALLDAGLPLPDYTVGVSAGIAYGVSYLSRQSRAESQAADHFRQ